MPGIHVADCGVRAEFFSVRRLGARRVDKADRGRSNRFAGGRQSFAFVSRCLRSSIALDIECVIKSLIIWPVSDNRSP